MVATAPHVGRRKQGVLEQLALDADTPLLDIRPHSLLGDRSYVKRICDIAPDGSPPLRVEGGHVEDDWRRSFERAGICLIAGSMLEEDSVAPTEHCFPSACYVPSETHTRRRVEE